jgi:DNA-binding beta-propeller fold protein YncE
VNSGKDAVLFFDRDAAGDVAPVRAIEGLRTGLSGPSGVFIDTKHDELWVTNWNNHTATVYPRMANGDVAPLRVIRSAPRGAPAVGLGNPGAVVYDPKRKEILVPN